MKKPKVKLIGEDGNVFAIIGRCVKALRTKDGKKAREFQEKALRSSSYDEVLQLAME